MVMVVIMHTMVMMLLLLLMMMMMITMVMMITMLSVMMAMVNTCMVGKKMKLKVGARDHEVCVMKDDGGEPGVVRCGQVRPVRVAPCFV
jgi:hypothetical protein